MSKTTLAAEIVRRLPDLVKDSPENAETVINNLMDEWIGRLPRKELAELWELPPTGKWVACDESGKPIDPNDRNLRDQFAMAALTGRLASYAGNTDPHSSEMALMAWDDADAMILVRKNRLDSKSGV